LTTPTPVRKAVLKPVATKAFNLPNGSRVDLAADLEAILTTAVANSVSFSPADPIGPGGDGCGTYLEVRAAVTTLELNAFELGLNFGYTPSGETRTGSGVTGKTNVRIGTIAMDFSVWQCSGGRCAAVGAATSSALSAGVNLSLNIDFGSVKTGPDLVYNTPLGNALRSIMNDGMKSLSKIPRLSELSWYAKVREVSAESGMLIFDAGTQSRIAAGQSFVIYAASASSGACDVYKAVANVRTVRVEAISSVAQIDESLDSRGVREGDIVMVRVAGGSR
jgi:hypothetical protein